MYLVTIFSILRIEINDVHLFDNYLYNLSAGGGLSLFAQHLAKCVAKYKVYAFSVNIIFNKLYNPTVLLKYGLRNIEKIPECGDSHFNFTNSR